MEYRKGSIYKFDTINPIGGHRLMLEFGQTNIRFIFNHTIIFDIPTKLFAQILKDSLEEKT